MKPIKTLSTARTLARECNVTTPFFRKVMQRQKIEADFELITDRRVANRAVQLWRRSRIFEIRLAVLEAKLQSPRLK